MYVDIPVLKIEYYCNQPNKKVFDAIDFFMKNSSVIYKQNLKRIHTSWIAGKQTILYAKEE